ncbi:hypothetical protein GYMLUDRAFT_943424 [Collybiopsis luxurians FD-317 M1]|uniref:Unplaced genomic scaffold GYMLUscaffold_84, whole genome shotgun sequence n=1 Tax=Collybiopsis luxurians FD-317 M1 TaxID=944289 RepID=A0A0D0AS19_9AGAR|nr:hypothetical protein GYMLUDRAFT_943424 [Collybiopsis luxurians FD-317 M1]
MISCQHLGYQIIPCFTLSYSFLSSAVSSTMAIDYPLRRMKIKCFDSSQVWRRRFYVFVCEEVLGCTQSGAVDSGIRCQLEAVKGPARLLHGAHPLY